MSDMKCPVCGGRLVYWGATGALLKCEQCKFGWGNEELWQELIRTKKQIEIYHEFVTKLYLNGNITDESLIRLQKLLYIQTKGGGDE